MMAFKQYFEVFFLMSTTFTKHLLCARHKYGVDTHVSKKDTDSILLELIVKTVVKKRNKEISTNTINALKKEK